ncbi:hypothetical protein HPP92_028221 [Vanilla planifolia]|uniref:Reticulon-like protein n=1 Tax=Vanilla planifolia TaxID=51239 RepID=A0A835P9X7_VANPL|nr:hypothetical protein HPP92_028221 [Vanilla planifolia]
MHGLFRDLPPAFSSVGSSFLRGKEGIEQTEQLPQQNKSFWLPKMSESVGHASLSDKIYDKIHEYKRSSSSDSEEEETSISKSRRKKRLFGRTEPVHTVLGGGKSADFILWRNKQISGSILAGVTVIWLLFEWMGYHLITFFCHFLIFALATLFLWSNAASFLNRSPPKFPETILSEDLFLTIAKEARFQINETFATFSFIASGKDLKSFLMAIGVLWIVSIIGKWFSFLTLFYIVFVVIYTVPVLYEKYEDAVDSAAGKAMVHINRQYAVLDEKVLQKIPRIPFAKKKKL